MESSYRNISQVKLDIKRIITNLKRLSQSNEKDDIENLRINTEQLLNKAERFPLEIFKCKLNRKQKRAKNRSQKNKKQSQKFNDQVSANIFKTKPLKVSEEPLQKLNGQSNNIKECKRFLQTFELLEQLHLSRALNSSEAYKFALKLRQLKSIWNSLLQDKLNDQTPKEVSIQQQWNEVFFGPSEKTYFELKPNLSDFVRKRQVWDSYIDSRHGSAIPLGWIVPNLYDRELWKSYLSLNTK